jgi:hypothetical protein
MGESLQLAWIQERVRNNQYLYTLHADEERREDGISIADVEQAILGGLLLEDYPNDRRGPSCLLYGPAANRPVHVVCGRNSAGWLVVITVYVPTLPKWKSPTERSDT